MKSQLKNLIRPHFIELEGYVSAGMESDKTADKIFMNANENPYELPGLERFNRYPEPQPKALAEAYANAYGVDANQIMMTRGADEAIVILTKLFCEPHEDEIIICPPTFGMYGVNAKTMPANILEVPLVKKMGTYLLDSEAIIKAAYNQEHSVKLVYICSPNNPTANSFTRDELRSLINELDGQAAVIVDETYAEFSEYESMTNYLNDHPNMIILRTLSKSYSMAGMRMGCFISQDPDFIALAKAKAMDAYPLPKASVEAAIYCLSDDVRKTAQDNIQKLLLERDRMKEALRASGKVREVFKSDANFLLVEMDGAAEFIKYAAEHDVILRDFSSKAHTQDCIRISVSLPEHNDLVLKLLNDF